jgi:hypothetical protein
MVTNIPLREVFYNLNLPYNKFLIVLRPIQKLRDAHSAQQLKQMHIIYKAILSYAYSSIAGSNSILGIYMFGRILLCC